MPLQVSELRKKSCSLRSIYKSNILLFNFHRGVAFLHLWHMGQNFPCKKQVRINVERKNVTPGGSSNPVPRCLTLNCGTVHPSCELIVRARNQYRKSNIAGWGRRTPRC